MIIINSINIAVVMISQVRRLRLIWRTWKVWNLQNNCCLKMEGRNLSFSRIITLEVKIKSRRCSRMILKRKAREIRFMMKIRRIAWWCYRLLLALRRDQIKRLLLITISCLLKIHLLILLVKKKSIFLVKK
jgi:hypothetical protein